MLVEDDPIARALEEMQEKEAELEDLENEDEDTEQTASTLASRYKNGNVVAVFVVVVSGVINVDGDLRPCLSFLYCGSKKYSLAKTEKQTNKILLSI